jgi:hypothetical protein
MKSILIKSAIASGVVLSLAAVTNPAMAASFVVSIEKAGQQTATYSNLQGYYEQTFNNINLNGQPRVYSTTGYTWTDGGKTIGTYDKTLIMKADQYGGAGGTQYFDVDSKQTINNIANGNTSSKLKFSENQSYFGLWWSAGDSTNALTFLSKGEVVKTITTADVKDYISKLGTNSSTTTNPYYGNPNSAFSNQNTGEPYAFINFYNTDGTFDEIQFTNLKPDGTLSGTGFESDNHTVAKGYTQYSGTIVKVVPESSSLLGVLAIGFVGASSFFTRRVKKSSVA